MGQEKEAGGKAALPVCRMQYVTLEFAQYSVYNIGTKCIERNSYVAGVKWVPVFKVYNWYQGIKCRGFCERGKPGIHCDGTKITIGWLTDQKEAEFIKLPEWKYIYIQVKIWAIWVGYIIGFHKDYRKEKKDPNFTGYFCVLFLKICDSVEYLYWLMLDLSI